MFIGCIYFVKAYIIFMSNPKIAILASKSGSTFEAIVNSCHSGALLAETVVMITNNSDSGVIHRAHSNKITCEVIDPKDFENEIQWDGALLKCLQSYDLQLIVLAGFLKKIGPQTLSAFKNKMINTHPSLLPKYGGKGMYGRKVHAAVLESGDSETGISIHLLSEVYDEGKIIAQCIVPVLAGDDVEKLESRVKQTEKEFYVDTLNKIINGEIQIT